MAKRKASSNSNPNATGGRAESLGWSQAMDEVLIDAFLHQQEIENRVSGTFTTQAYENIVKELKDAFPDKPIDKEKVKNRMKYIKKGFGTCYDIFRNGTSGFQWSPITNMWIAEPEVWSKLIESHPEAAEWQNKTILHYDKLKKLYGQDRANGDNAETPEEMRQRIAQTMDQREGDAISEIDRLVAENEAAIEGLGDENSSSPETAKRMKKLSRELLQVEILKGIKSVGDSIVRSTESLMKAQNSTLPVPAAEIWQLVVELNIDPAKELTAYRFLIKNPGEVEALIGCPMEIRKEYLMGIIP